MAKRLLSLFHRPSLLVFMVLAISANAREIELECTDNYIHYDSRYIKSCTVQSLTVISSEDILVSVNGDNKTTDYESIEIVGQAVNFIPKQFGTFFAKVKRLTISSSQLQAIEKSDLAAFSELSYLDLSLNRLTSLDGDLFEFNPNLYEVNFNDNQLKNIGEDLLDVVSGLRNANFGNNVCIDLLTNWGHSLEAIKNIIREACPSIKDMKRKYCSEDIQQLADRIEELERLLEEEKSNSKAMFMKCDGILDIATERLLQTSKRVNTCSKVDSRTSEDAEKGEMDLKVAYSLSAPDNFSLEVVGMRVESPGMSIKTVEFAALTNFTNLVQVVRDQTSFSVEDQQTLFFPINLGDHLPQLEYLIIMSSGLFEIDSRIFETLPALRKLVLKDNKLQEIPSDTLSNLKNLTVLDLSYNKIRSLDRDVFKALMMLTKLDLDHNLLVTVNGAIFDNLKALEILHLNNNKLKFISANLLTPLTKLELVTLTNNICIDMEHPESSLAAIEAKIIDSCIEPIELKCKAEETAANSEKKMNGGVCNAVDLVIEYPKTKISTVKDDFGKDATVLSITSQQTLYLPFQLAKTFLKLEKIIVEHSKMTALMKQDFDGLKLLKHVAITFNNITSIEEGTFDEVTQIEHLSLASNNIKTLPSKLFNQLNRLKILVLSNNLLQKFTASLLPPKNVIEEFQIQNNQLDLIETKTLRFLRKAKLIDMTENVCIDMKYEKSKNNSRALVELSGEIDLNCSEDDMR